MQSSPTQEAKDTPNAIFGDNCQLTNAAHAAATTAPILEVRELAQVPLYK